MRRCGMAVGCQLGAPLAKIVQRAALNSVLRFANEKPVQGAARVPNSYGLIWGGLAPPGTDLTAIHMHKIGPGIAPNATRATRGSGTGHLSNRAAGEAQIGSLSLQVQ